MAGPSIHADAFFHDLPPLPEGWDWNRISSLSGQELFALPEDQQALIGAYQRARHTQWNIMRGADDAAAARRSDIFHRTLKRLGLLMPTHPTGTEPREHEIDLFKLAAGEYTDEKLKNELGPEELAVVERYGLPEEQVGTPLFEIAEVMHRQECQYWGFVAFRVYGYGDVAPRWDAFMSRWHEMMNEQLGRLLLPGITKVMDLKETDEGFEARFQQLYTAAASGGIMSRWRLEVRQHEQLNGMNAQDVRALFRIELQLDEEEDESLPNRVPIGVDPGLCFMVDEGVVNSLLNEGGRPYVIGVLSDIDQPEVPENAEVIQFKIALESVVDLWRQIQVQSMYDLEPPEGKIYISPGVFEGCV